MKRSILVLNNIRLRPSQIHKFRGFIGNLFREYDLIHNHDAETGKPIYRYPLIQFKLVNRQPAIIAITEEAVSAFANIFMKLDRIVIDEMEIPVYEKDLELHDADFGYSTETFVYEFASPWMGLNQKNYQRYMKAVDQAQRDQVLKGALIGNMLSMSKYLGHWLDREQEIRAEVRVRECQVNLKGKHMIGFTGIFKANFMIPDHLGLGKSVSRGFGTVMKKI
ncbi:MAG: DNA repair protein [Deltaproteobacteria bacterium]|nr:MAG: DNA repair protein [Deltaproteobacteria bacterium]